MRIFSRLVLLILFISGACSSERNTFTNRTFHNITAHYNAYYLANERLTEVEKEIKANYNEDYTQILPVFIPIDSATIQANKENIESSRELASKAIEWHKISKWVDDSYFILGKLDYLQANFDDAKNTFKYINANSKDNEVRHQTLIALLKLYVGLGEFENANFTIDYLSKESGITKTNRYDLYRTLAHYYEKRGDKSGVIGALDKALEYVSDVKEKSRINFILAQRYQREGLDALAYDYYNQALEGNPPYVRSFYATLYAQQVAELNKSKDLKKVRKYYDELYNNPKNQDLKDVVVYERALFEQKQGDTRLTLDLLHQAAKEPGSNPRVKGYIYQKLAEINLEVKDYSDTKYYLDSALTYIKDTDPVAIDIKNQKESLDKYVFHKERIQRNDSLLVLSKMSIEEQTLVAQNYIEGEEARLMKEAEATQPKEKGGSIFDNLLAFSDRGSGSTFYFNNPVAMQQGALDFRRNWGNRPLQDNWRRSAAGFQMSTPTTPEPVKDDSLALNNEKTPIQQVPTAEDLLAEIPKSPDEISSLNLELEESYFELGKLLYFDLKEEKQSINNLETLVRVYPNSSRKPEAYYLLYLAQKDIDGNFQQYVGRLNREYPESQYSFSVNNPEAASGNLAYVESSKRYKTAYDAYYAGDYQNAKRIINSTLQEYPLTRNTERLLLLDIMVAGKTESQSKYKERLENYIQNSQNSDLVELARNMLKPLLTQTELAALNPSKIIEGDSTNIDKSKSEVTDESNLPSDTPYTFNNSQTHIFVIAMDPSQAEQAKNLLGDLESFHASEFSSSRLRTGNMNMSRENAIYIISPFTSGEKAMEYYHQFQKEFESEGLLEQIKKDSFVISIENFQVLNKSKNLEEYRTFFKSTYK